MAYTTNPRLPRVRQEAAYLVKQCGWSTRKVARHLGYSQAAVVGWCKRDICSGLRPIQTKSSRPHFHPRALDTALVDTIVSKRVELKRSAEVIHKALREDGIVVSISSVKRTLDREGLLKKRSPWKRYHAHTPRPDVEKQGDLVELDTIHLITMNGTKIYVFTLLDVWSRWAYARAYVKANTRTALDFLVRARLQAPFSFLHLQSDHGSEFSTHFTERSGTPHRHSRVRMPNDNAHLERFNRTIQEELLDNLSRDARTINRALPKYLEYYNSRRYHFGLNLKTPLEVITSY